VLAAPKDYLQFTSFKFGCLVANRFTICLLCLTPLSAFEDQMHIVSRLNAAEKICPTCYMNEIINRPSPKFVYVHSLIPHDPWVFDERGNRFGLTHDIDRGYISSVKLAERLTEGIINKILASTKAGEKPIIIVQSDHGPMCISKDYDKYYNGRMRIFNAYYLPDMNNKELYESISPVNSFRVIFNDYFGTKFPLLPDRAYCAPNMEDPPDGKRHLREVTDRVVFD
jgi:hypothetical protein